MCSVCSAYSSCSMMFHVVLCSSMKLYVALLPALFYLLCLIVLIVPYVYMCSKRSTCPICSGCDLPSMICCCFSLVVLFVLYVLRVSCVLFILLALCVLGRSILLYVVLCCSMLFYAALCCSTMCYVGICCAMLFYVALFD